MVTNRPINFTTWAMVHSKPTGPPVWVLSLVLGRTEANRRLRPTPVQPNMCTGPQEKKKTSHFFRFQSATCNRWNDTSDQKWNLKLNKIKVISVGYISVRGEQPNNNHSAKTMKRLISLGHGYCYKDRELLTDNIERAVQLNIEFPN